MSQGVKKRAVVNSEPLLLHVLKEWLRGTGRNETRRRETTLMARSYLRWV